jgi:hypothetical protein
LSKQQNSGLLKSAVFEKAYSRRQFTNYQFKITKVSELMIDKYNFNLKHWTVLRGKKKTSN